MEYSEEKLKQFKYEYDHGDEWNGRVVIKYTFGIDLWGQNDEELYLIDDEEFFAVEDYVISEEGELIGFLLEEKTVLWIADFEKGGKYYDGYGMVIKDNGIRRTYACLTYSRW